MIFLPRIYVTMLCGTPMNKYKGVIKVGSMGAIAPIDFEKGVLHPSTSWKLGLKGNLHPSIKFPNCWLGLLHPSIEIPYDSSYEYTPFDNQY